MSTQSAHSLSSLTVVIASALGKELDEPFKRILADKIDLWRSRLIRNSLQEKPQESKFFRQTIYVPLELVNPLPDCLQAGAPVCKVLRSTQDIPRPLRFGSQLLDFVGSIDGRTAFSMNIPGAGDFLLSGRYSRKNVLYEYLDGPLEIHNAPGLRMVRIDGVFDKPSEAMRFNCEVAGTGCDYWEEPYPCTGDVLQQVIQYILQEYGQPAPPSNKEVDVNPQNQQHAPDGR